MSGASHQALLMTGDDKDPYYAQVHLLTHLDGPVGTNVIVDNGPYNIPDSKWTKLNQGANPEYSVAGRFNQSLRIASNTSYIEGGTLAVPTLLNPGTSDFTVECFILAFTPASYSNGQGILSWTFTSFANNPIVNFFFYKSAIAEYIAVSTYINGVYTQDIPLQNPTQWDVWNHLAATRQGNTFRAFVNGQLAYTGTMTGTFGTLGGKFSLGNGSTQTSRLLDEVRLTVGVARYTSNFAPPSKPFPNS